MNKRKLCGAALVAAALALATGVEAAWNYRVELTKHMHGLAIDAHASNGPAVTVVLNNHSSHAAQCSASFVSYPHDPAPDEILHAKVPAGKKVTLGYPVRKLGSAFSTVFVEVTCKA